MYYAIVATVMFLFPLLSIAIAATVHPVFPELLLVGKWYVFWAVGVRLLLAGLRQIIQPRYTAQTILGIQGEEVLLVVRELGFANVSLGVLGCISLLSAHWVVPAALAGGLFYALAGINHTLHGPRNRLQSVAMVSDLFAAAVLLAWGGWALSVH